MNELQLEKEFNYQDCQTGDVNFYEVPSDLINSLKFVQSKVNDANLDFKNKKIDMAQYIKSLDLIDLLAKEKKVSMKISENNELIAYSTLTLKLEYQTDKQIADRVRSQKKHTLYVIFWEESERGWGTRPDGCSIHISEEAANNFIQKQFSSLPTDYVPDEYSRPCTKIMLTEVSRDLYEYFMKKHLSSMSIYINSLHGLKNYEIKKNKLSV